jgi:hypothetical protein
VHGIVKQSGGRIWVYSEISRGTTFKIYLPSAEHKLGLSSERRAEALPRNREGMTILLAEDDTVMRKLTRKMLEGHGYKVIEGIDGEAALELISENAAHRFDLDRRRDERDERAGAGAASEEFGSGNESHLHVRLYR